MGRKQVRADNFTPTAPIFCLLEEFCPGPQRRIGGKGILESGFEPLTLIGMMSALEITGLAGSAAGAGAVNALAGGGTLLTFPTLLAFGTPPLVANATSTLALVMGTSGGILGNRQHLKAITPWLWRFVPVSIVGGLIGSILLTHTSNAVFGKLVPFLILFATILFLAQGAFRRFAGSHLDVTGDGKGAHVGAAVAFQFAVAIYGGYFGAGIGILMLATLGFMGLRNIYEMNTLKTIMGSLLNLVAALWFIGAGLIDWPRAAVMTVGAVAGYYLASHYSQKISQARVRQIITAIGFIISGVTFYEQFIR